jgi:excisionase family DNA binding protein
MVRQPQPEPAVKQRPDPEGVQKRLYSVAETTKALGVGKSTVWAMIASKQIEPVRLGTRTFIRSEDIDLLATKGMPHAGR